MASSESVDSGRFSGGRSNFSQTCSLLSQYLKEKGSFGELSLGFPHNSEPKGAPETMNLLSMIEKSGSRNLDGPPAVLSRQVLGRDETQKKSDLSGAKPETETAPLTIFYGGRVIVFNDFPADKAQEILRLASKSSATQKDANSAFAPPHLAAQSPVGSTATTNPDGFPANFGTPERPYISARPPLDSDLPIPRKNSLARFLEKRKDRITGNAPYPASNQRAAPPPKPVKSDAWLGLAAPQLPLQIHRH